MNHFIMRDTFLPLALIVLSLSYLTACNDGYSIDFSSKEFPGTSKLSKTEKDSLLRAEDAYYKTRFDKNLKAETDRMKYLVGEEIILTVVNNTKETEYFCESKESSQNHFDAFPNVYKSDQENYLNGLVSKNPGIIGKLYFNDPLLIGLYLEGTNAVVASKIGFEAFDQPLDPGEKMSFRITMPKRAGYYRCLIRRYSPDSPQTWTYGMDPFIVSNTFEILAK